MTDPGPILDLPYPLLPGGLESAPTVDGMFDVQLGGAAFNLKITAETPHQRESPQSEREQTDAAPEAGENTLRSWWLRSQMSFHCGAGVDYLDTVVDYDPIQRARFFRSRGVDPWTPGLVTRLPGVSNILTSGASTVLLAAAEFGGVEKLVVAGGTSLQIVTDPAGTAVPTTVTWGGASTILALACDGASWYAATTTNVYKGSLDGTAGAILYTYAAVTSVVLGWSKERLIAGLDNKVYELGAVGPALPAAVYTHPSTAWKWTAVSESPTGVLVAGGGGSGSSIYKFALSEDAVPVLSPGSVTASMPTGEKIISLFQYVGSLLAIGTNRGIRIGTFDTFYANLTYGPLTVACGPVRSFTGRDRFIYATVDLFESASGLVRLDLGQPVDQTGNYAYATDLTAPSQGNITAVVTTPGGRLIMGQAAVGVLLEGAVPAATGDAWLETARIRFGTVEPKVFHYAQVQGVGPLTVKATTRGTAETLGFTMATPGDRFSLGLTTRDEWISIRILLDQSTSQLSSYQIYALPAAKRSALIGLPLMCLDFETDRGGQNVGYPGWAWVRWGQLEALDSSRSVTTYRSPTLGDEVRQVVIERLSFSQTADPGADGGFGGVVNVVLRTMD